MPLRISVDGIYIVLYDIDLVIISLYLFITEDQLGFWVYSFNYTILYPLVKLNHHRAQFCPIFPLLEENIDRIHRLSAGLKCSNNN